MTLKNEYQAMRDYYTPPKKEKKPQNASPMSGRGRMTNDNQTPLINTNQVNRVPISFNKPNGKDFSFGSLIDTNSAIQTGRAGMQNNAQIQRNLKDTKVINPALIPSTPLATDVANTPNDVNVPNLNRTTPINVSKEFNQPLWTTDSKTGRQVITQAGYDKAYEDIRRNTPVGMEYKRLPHGNFYVPVGQSDNNMQAPAQTVQNRAPIVVSSPPTTVSQGQSRQWSNNPQERNAVGVFELRGNDLTQRNIFPNERGSFDVAPRRGVLSGPIEDHRAFHSTKDGDSVTGGFWDHRTQDFYKTKQGAILGLTEDRIDKQIDQRDTMERQRSVNQNKLNTQALSNKGAAQRQAMANRAAMERTKYQTDSKRAASDLANRQAEAKYVQNALNEYDDRNFGAEQDPQARANYANQAQIRYNQIVNEFEKVYDEQEKKRYFRNPKTGKYYDENLNPIGRR